MPFPNLTTEVDQQLANIRQTAKTIARHASDVGEYMEEPDSSQLARLACCSKLLNEVGCCLCDMASHG